MRQTSILALLMIAFALSVQGQTADEIAKAYQDKAAAACERLDTALRNQGSGIAAKQVSQGDTAGATGSFARGGYTGPGGKYQPAGIVHFDEYVTRSEIVRQRGALEFLERFNRYGMAALPGYADGGLVGRLAIPTLRSPQPVNERMAATFNFPGLGSYRATVSADTFRQLQNDFQRAALQKGGRR